MIVNCSTSDFLYNHSNLVTADKTEQTNNTIDLQKKKSYTHSLHVNVTAPEYRDTEQ